MADTKSASWHRWSSPPFLDHGRCARLLERRGGRKLTATSNRNGLWARLPPRQALASMGRTAGKRRTRTATTGKTQPESQESPTQNVARGGANNGGEAGIRTLGRLAPSLVFETSPIDHSGTSPKNALISNNILAGLAAVKVWPPPVAQAFPMLIRNSGLVLVRRSRSRRSSMASNAFISASTLRKAHMRCNSSGCSSSSSFRVPDRLTSMAG